MQKSYIREKIQELKKRVTEIAFTRNYTAIEKLALEVIIIEKIVEKEFEDPREKDLALEMLGEIKEKITMLYSACIVENISFKKTKFARRRGYYGRYKS